MKKDSHDEIQRTESDHYGNGMIRLENIFLDIMKQLSDEQKSPLDIAKNIVEMAAHLVSADICTWFRVTSDRQKLVLVAAYGTKSELVPAEGIYDLPWDAKKDEEIKGLTAWLAVRGEEFSANSFRQLCAHRSHRGAWDDHVWGHRPEKELKSWFGVPITLGQDREPRDSVIGVLKVERSTEEQPFTEQNKYVVRLMAKYIAISLEYRNTITAKFLQQVGHPLWGAMQTIINIIKDSYTYCGELANMIEVTDMEPVKNFLMELRFILQSGLTQAEFVNRSMTSIKKMVLPLDDSNVKIVHSEKDLIQIAKGIIRLIEELATAQIVTFPNASGFKVELENESKSLKLFLTDQEEDALKTITTEFLYNALKHARSGKRAILKINEINNREAIRLEVKDFGQGISPENLQHIFDEGFHTHAQFAPEGVGFGLTMVRSVTRKFGWPLPEVKLHADGVSFVIQIPKRGDKNI